MKIFVAVGTQKFPFNRILKMVDIISITSSYEVYAQSRNSSYVPSYRNDRFLTTAQFEEEIKQSDLVITHGGVSTIVKAMSYMKPIIVVPRLVKYGEHIDDHQVEIAKAFAKEGLILMYDDGDSDIRKMIENTQSSETRTYVSSRETVVSTIRNYLRDQLGEI